MRRTLIIIILVVVTFGIVAARQAQPTPINPNPQTTEILDRTTAERGDLRLTVSATGVVVPNREVPLLFESSGVVREVYVTAGQSVRAGEVLAALDTADLLAALDDAQVGYSIQQIAYNALTSPASAEDLAAAEAAVNVALAQLNAASSSADPNAAEIARLRGELARNQLWQAQLQSGIAESLTAQAQSMLPNGQLPPGVSLPSVPGGASQQSLAQAEYGVQIADANAAAAAEQGADPGSVASANASVVSAQAQLDLLLNGPNDLDLQAAQINVDMARLAVEQAQAALDRATLIAPFDGVIAVSNLVQGEVPPNDQPAFLLVDDAERYVTLAVDETDVVRLSVGQPVEITFDALPDGRITSAVSRISVAPTVTGQLVTYAVRVPLVTQDAQIRIGMSATATVIVDRVEDVLLVPNRFIRIDRTTGGAFVTAQGDNGRFRELPVQLGLRNELSSEVTAGLEAGQALVLLPRAAFDVFGS